MKKQYTAPAIEEHKLEMETIIALSDGDGMDVVEDGYAEQMSKERESFGLW